MSKIGGRNIKYTYCYRRFLTTLLSTSLFLRLDDFVDLFERRLKGARHVRARGLAHVGRGANTQVVVTDLCVKNKFKFVIPTQNAT